MGKARIAGLTGALAVAGALAAAGPAPARVVLEFETGPLSVTVDAGDRLLIEDGRRDSVWEIATAQEADPGATEAVGPALALERQRLATRRRPLRGSAGIACGGDGTGVAYAFGTVHRRVWRAVAQTSDGTRFSLILARPPRTWGTSRKAVLQVFGKRSATTPPTRMFAYDDDGRLIRTIRFSGLEDCE